MIRSHQHRLWFIPAVLALLLTACTPAQVPATQALTATSEPTATNCPPSATATLTATPLPTETQTPEPTNTPRPTAVPFLFPVSDDPIIPIEPGTWNGRYIEPGAAVFHDGQFHVFFNAFTSWPGRVSVGYATSVDGVEWDIRPEPVITREETDDIEYIPYALYVSDVLIEEDGTWVLYFYTWDQGLASAPSSIGRATASDPLGPWTFGVVPSLKPARLDGHWDSYSVRNPAVVKTEEGYMMFYAGTDISGVPIPQNDIDQIGMATSTDGINWSKFNDPDTTEPPYSLSDPVLGPHEDRAKWDGKNVHRPAVEMTPFGLVMFYRANKGNIGTGNQTAYGFAISEDGIHWTRYDSNPIMRPSLFSSSDMYATNMIFHDGLFYVFAEVSQGQNTEVFLATGVWPVP
jgi:predicted GH43/DUF377 family glycosyl hydrolase